MMRYLLFFFVIVCIGCSKSDDELMRVDRTTPAFRNTYISQYGAGQSQVRGNSSLDGFVSRPDGGFFAVHRLIYDGIVEECLSCTWWELLVYSISPEGNLEGEVSSGPSGGVVGQVGSDSKGNLISTINSDGRGEVRRFPLDDVSTFWQLSFPERIIQTECHDGLCWFLTSDDNRYLLKAYNEDSGAFERELFVGQPAASNQVMFSIGQHGAIAVAKKQRVGDLIQVTVFDRVGNSIFNEVINNYSRPWLLDVELLNNTEVVLGIRSIEESDDRVLHLLLVSFDGASHSLYSQVMCGFSPWIMVEELNNSELIVSTHRSWECVDQTSGSLRSLLSIDASDGEINWNHGFDDLPDSYSDIVFRSLTKVPMEE
jgi:hypothetical protein